MTDRSQRGFIYVFERVDTLRMQMVRRSIFSEDR